MSSALHAALRMRAATVQTPDTRLWAVVGPLLDRHIGRPIDVIGNNLCEVCGTHMPCPELRIIAAALGVSTDEGS